MCLPVSGGRPLLPARDTGGIPSTLGCCCHRGAVRTQRLGQDRDKRGGTGRARGGFGGPRPPPLTQWLAKLRVMTAGAKERAGFMLAPV